MLPNKSCGTDIYSMNLKSHHQKNGFYFTVFLSLYMKHWHHLHFVHDHIEAGRLEINTLMITQYALVWGFMAIIYGWWGHVCWNAQCLVITPRVKSCTHIHVIFASKRQASFWGHISLIDATLMVQNGCLAFRRICNWEGKLFQLLDNQDFSTWLWMVISPQARKNLSATERECQSQNMISMAVQSQFLVTWSSIPDSNTVITWSSRPTEEMENPWCRIWKSTLC